MKMIGAIVLLLLAGGTFAAGSEEFDRTAAEGAARIVLGSLADEITAGGPAAQKLLADRMLADPGAYRGASAAKDALKSVYGGEFAARYNAEAAKVLARLARERKPEEVFSKEFLEVEAKLPQERVDAAVEKSYGGDFAAARRTACEKQAAELQTDVRPTEVEFETLKKDELRKLLTERVAANQKTPVFEENLEIIDGRFAAPMIAEAEKQRNRQRERVRRHETRAIAPSVAAKELAADLVETVAAKRAAVREGEYVHNVFPSVTNAYVNACAENNLLERAAAKVAGSESPVEGSSITEVFDRTPGKFVSSKDMVKEFRPSMVKFIADQVVEYVKSEAVDGEKDEVSSYLGANSEKGAFGKAVAKMVDEDCMPLVAELRAAWARKQFVAIHPELSAGEWYPSDELADETAPKHDFDKVVARWRLMPELDKLVAAENGKPVWEETYAAADREVKAAFARGRSARNAQMDLAEKCGAKTASEAHSASEKPSLKTLVDRMTAEVLAGWEESRERVLWSEECPPPANAAEHFPRLLPSVLKRIEQLAKTIVEAEKQPTPEEKPPEPVPEDTPSDATPEETPKVMALDLSFSSSGNSTVIKIAVNHSAIGTWSCRCDSKNFRADLEKAQKSIRKAFGDTMRQLGCGPDSEITVMVMDADDSIFYRTVLGTVHALKDASDDVGITKFTAEIDLENR